MKITVDVDCTPEEARKFLGLPDVAPLQESMMAQMQARMEEAAAAMNPEAIMKTLFPKVEGLADLQKAFWSQFTASRTPKP